MPRIARSAKSGVSIAKVISPREWVEPGQRPELTEYTAVLSGTLCVEYKGSVMEVRSGQPVVTEPEERVRYFTPERAAYLGVCIPAFLPHTVHRYPP